jgi:ribosomal-protein-serine acetyltransferase
VLVEQLDLPAGRERPGVEERLHDQPEREGQRSLGEAVRVARAQVPGPLGVGDQGAEPLPAAPVLARVGGTQTGVGERGVPGRDPDPVAGRGLARERQDWVGPAFVTDDVEGARATLRRYAERQAADGGRLFGLRLDGVLVGGVMFVEFDAGLGSCEIGCWLEPAAEGCGLVTRACETLLDWAFGARGLHRAEWRCRADNTRSSAVAERLGMVREGVLREYWPYDGARCDKEIWAILAPEWTERRR